MYRAHFRSSENPFALTPDPRFLFVGQRQREALAHLLYGIGESGGFVLLTGEVGTGKTTLCRSVLEQAPEEADIALILNPKQTALELVASVCDELGVSHPPGTTSLKLLTDLLNRHLLESHAAGRRTAVVIDEAQNLSPEVLEQVRLLTNLETTTQKLLQILLIGQPELQNLLARPDLRQVDQRITARYHLLPLLAGETGAYIRHRLEVAGFQGQPFSRGALRLVHRRSGGVPRLINIICERALLGAYGQQRDRIDRSLVRRAIVEVMGRTRRRPNRRLAWLALAAAVPACAIVAWWFAPELVLKFRESGGAPEMAGDPATTGAPRAGGESPQESSQSDLMEATLGLDSPTESAGGGLDRLPTGQPPGEDGTREKGFFADVFAGGATKTDGATAFAALFQHWGLAYAEGAGANACDQAAAAGLRCLDGKGNWTTLAHYDRPAVLELIDRGDRHHRVVAAQLGEKQVTLDFGGRKMTVAKEDVDPYWFGDFILLWKPPPFAASLLRQGHSGPEISWLREQLDRADNDSPGAPGEAASPLFDSELKQRVIDFQRSHALRPDGVVGEQTFIQLQAAVQDPLIPALKRRPQ